MTWEWDFDRQGVHAGHYFMENYEAAKRRTSLFRAGWWKASAFFQTSSLL
ncbi:MAG: hypothetical protein V8T01_04670 [Oscillospiraceae bacterium]